jgi:soluble lytic murein transglycosylase-like protein
MKGKETLITLGLGLAALFAVGQGSGRAQTVDFTPAALDAWRAKLMERLDADVAELSVPTPGQPPASVVSDWRGDQRPVSQPVWSPQPGQRRRLPWLPAVAAILREHGLSAGLVHVAAVESGLDPAALSPKGARGLWQLMPETATRYGLVVNSESDERLDPVKSTHAAARYLKELHRQFQDWPLALAAYNAGEDRVKRALEQLGARDFWTLSRRAALPDETRRYVPAVLARVTASLGPRNFWWLQTPIPNPAAGNTTTHADHAAARAHVLYAATSPGR